MKKIYSYAMLLLAGAFAMTSCDKDIDSNPVLIEGDEPVAIVLNTPEFFGNTLDLEGTETMRLTWSQPVLTTMNAPLASSGSLGLSYAIQLSKDNSFTYSFDDELATIPIVDGDEGREYESTPEEYDYAQLTTTYSSCDADVSSEDMNKALNKLFLWDKNDDLDAVEVYLRVVGFVKMSYGPDKLVAVSNVYKLTFLPSEWIDVMEVPAEISYYWVPGNGNGWNHGVAPILVSSDGKVYKGYAYMDGQFKFTPEDNWNNGELNNGDFESASDNIDLSRTDDSNIDYTGNPGMCYITLDVKKKTLEVTPVTWSIVGDAVGGWDNDVVLVYDKDNHCLIAEVEFSEGGWKFRRDFSWDVNLGGNKTNGKGLDDLDQDGDNITAQAGTFTVQLFIERPVEDKDHPDRGLFYGKVTAQQ